MSSAVWKHTTSRFQRQHGDKYMYIYMYIYVYIYTYTHTHALKHPRTHTHTHTHTHICIHICIYLIIYVYIHIHIYIYIYIYIYTYMCIYIYIYVYIYMFVHTNTYTHTHTHTHTHIAGARRLWKRTTSRFKCGNGDRRCGRSNWARETIGVWESMCVRVCVCACVCVCVCNCVCLYFSFCQCSGMLSLSSSIEVLHPSHGMSTNSMPSCLQYSPGIHLTNSIFSSEFNIVSPTQYWLTNPILCHELKFASRTH